MLMILYRLFAVCYIRRYVSLGANPLHAIWYGIQDCLSFG